MERARIAIVGNFVGLRILPMRNLDASVCRCIESPGVHMFSFDLPVKRARPGPFNLGEL
jgi:hypothetical protein